MSTPTVSQDALHYSKTSQAMKDTVITNTGAIENDLLMFEVIRDSQGTPELMTGPQTVAHTQVSSLLDLPPDTGDKIRVDTRTGEVTSINFERSVRFEEVRQMMEDFEREELQAKAAAIGVGLAGAALVLCLAPDLRRAAWSQLTEPASTEPRERRWFNLLAASNRQMNAALIAHYALGFSGFPKWVAEAVGSHSSAEVGALASAGAGVASAFGFTALAKKLL